MNHPTAKSTAQIYKTIPSGFQTRFSKRITLPCRAAFPAPTLLLTLCLAILLVSGLNAQESQAQETQNWQGVLDVGSAKLTMNVEIKKESQGYSAVMFAVEQGNAKIPVDKVDVTDKEINLIINSVKASFEGTIDESGQLCKGTFTQHGAKFDLELKRVNSFEAEPAGELVEYWKGTADNEDKMEMGLKIFRTADGSLTAKFSSYSQGVIDFPVGFEKNGDDYRVTIPEARFEYSGTLDQSKQKISGKIQQGDSETKLEFTKAALDSAPKYNRPQTPQSPFPYESEEVSYENSKQAAKLAGTLTLPSGEGPFPVAITISGSGPADRDESQSGHKPFLVIADHLARQGIAVLRFDDRGVGESTGERSGATCCGADLKMQMIDDAVVDYIRDFSQQPKLLRAVVEASAEATRVGVKELEKQRTKLSKQLSKREKDSMSLVDRLTDPAFTGITAIKDRLAELEKDQQSLKSQITELTLQIRDRRDMDVSTEEVQAAYEDFAGLWDELEFDERQYATRLLLKQVTLNFKKKEKEGSIKIEAWGRRPKPLKLCLATQSRKLRNQNGRLPRQGSNLRQTD